MSSNNKRPGSGKRPNSPRYSDRYGKGHVNPYLGGQAGQNAVYKEIEERQNAVRAENEQEARRAEERARSASRPERSTEEARGGQGAEQAAAAEAARASHSTARKKTRENSHQPAAARDPEMQERLRQIQEQAMKEARALRDEADPEAGFDDGDTTPDVKLKLSEDNKPLIALESRGKDGRLEVKWIPVVLSDEDMEAFFPAIEPAQDIRGIKLEEKKELEQNGGNKGIPDEDGLVLIPIAGLDDQPTAVGAAAVELLDSSPEKAKKKKADKDRSKDSSVMDSLPVIAIEEVDNDYSAAQDTEEEPQDSEAQVTEEQPSMESEPEIPQEETSDGDESTEEDPEASDEQSDEPEEEDDSSEAEEKSEDEASDGNETQPEESAPVIEYVEPEEEAEEEESSQEEPETEAEAEESEDESDDSEAPQNEEIPVEEPADQTEADEQQDDDNSPDQTETEPTADDTANDNSDESESENQEQPEKQPGQQSGRSKHKRRRSRPTDVSCPAELMTSEQQESSDDEASVNGDDFAYIQPAAEENSAKRRTAVAARPVYDDLNTSSRYADSRYQESDGQDDSLFIRKDRPGSTTLFMLPGGANLPRYIDDDDFVERWLGNEEDEDMASDSKRRRRRISTFIGAATMLLALIGFIAVAKWGIGLLSGIGNTDTQKTEYAGFISPIVMSEVPVFETWDAIPQDKLLQSAIFNVLEEMNVTYERDDTGKFIIPSTDIVNSVKELYGAKHEDPAQDEEINTQIRNALYGSAGEDTTNADVYYVDMEDSFHVADGLSGPAPQVTDISRRDNTVTLVVQYLEDLEGGSGGILYAREYILTLDGEGYYVQALREYEE